VSSFGRYEILEKLGAGGMAEVYLARAYGADGFVKDLVLKKVLATRADDTQFRKMFVDEAKITVSLSHTNIVQVFDFGKVDDTYFLAMERVHGSDLRKVLSRLEDQGRRIPLPIALQVVCEVLKGLDYAHRRTTPEGRPLGIVHRDVSPSNILLSYEGEVKIADFGIARGAEKAEEGTGTVIGKPRYMAPEQIRGEPVDARADVFGCGVVLVEMLLGEQPFATSNDMDTFAMVLTGTTVKPLDTASSGIPADFIPIVQKAMATDAGVRFPSAASFLKAIEDYAIDRRIRLSAAPLAELLHSTHPPSMTLTRPDPGPTREGPTIFERVSAGPGEVAHFTQQDSKIAAVGAVSSVKTARVDVSVDLGRRRAPRLAAGLITLGVAVTGVWQAGLLGGLVPAATPAPTETPLAASSETSAATPVESATPIATAISTRVAVRPSPTPRRTATPVIVVATSTPVAAKPKGWLKLNSIPWGEVSINGKPIGKTTPIQRLDLAPGRYVIEIRNPKTGASGTLSVTIESGKETVHGLELK